MLYFWVFAKLGSMEKHPIELHGNWEWGIALDLHTKASSPIFDEEGKIIGWDTTRTEIGEELYRLKYKNEPQEQKLKRVERLAAEIADVVFWLWDKLSPQMEIDKRAWRIVSVPPSRERNLQPVEE